MSQLFRTPATFEPHRRTAARRRAWLTSARRSLVVLTAVSLVLPVAADAQQRLPTIPPAQYNQAQRQAAAEFLAARKFPVEGPFDPMMYSPEVLNRARALGDYLRYKSAIGNTMSELAILITAREWGQEFEWSVHAPIAAKAGIQPAVIAAIRDGRRPDHMSSDEQVTYDFATELLRNKRVSDPSFAAAEARFGKQGVVDLVAILGYYSFDAMLLNAARFQPQQGKVLPRFPD